MRVLLCSLLLVFAAGDSWWSTHPTGSESNLRGLALVVHHSSVNVWATGSKGTVLHSVDGGNTWQAMHIAGAESLDFRGIQTFDGKAIYVMSSGPGDASRIYKSEDGGGTWKVQYTDKRKPFFLDALACSDEKHCFALSDPVGGKFLLLATSDGSTWKELPREHMPDALPQDPWVGVFTSSVRRSLLLFSAW